MEQHFRISGFLRRRRNMMFLFPTRKYECQYGKHCSQRYKEITELVKECAKACCRDKDTVKDLDDRSLLIHVSDLFSPAGNLKTRPWNNCIHILHRHNPGVGHADADSLIKLLTSLRSYRSCSRHCSHPYHHNVPCYFCPECRGYDPQVKV